MFRNTKETERSVPVQNEKVHRPRRRYSLRASVGKYEEISAALRVLGLYDSATVKEMKSRYRELLREWHPDLCRENETVRSEKTIEIITAYKVIMEYCEQYRFSFTREEVEKYLSPEELWEKQFGKDPIWGNYQDDEKK